MGKEILNRREKIAANSLPPEILDEATLKSDGFVTNTDFATTDTAGVVKVSGSLGSAVSSGVLQGTTRAQSAYDSGSAALIISKGTLENIKFYLLESAFSEYCDATYPEATVGQFALGLRMTKTADGWKLDFTTSAN